MARKPRRRKRSIIFSSNLDFQTTLETLHQNEMVESIDYTGTRGKDGEGKSAEGGKLLVTMKEWDPPNMMISPKGHIECWYYEDTSDINEVVKQLPEGWAYAYPEYTAVESIGIKLSTLLAPISGKELCLQIINTSIPLDYFIELRSQRYERKTIRPTDVKHVCSCGKSYKSRTWYEKHIEKCSNYDTSKAGISVKAIFAEPGPLTVVGQSPFGLVRFTEMRTWEELKKAAERQREIPILLDHPRKLHW